MSEPFTAEQVARYIVAEAVWAPSVHNTSRGGSALVAS